MLEHSESGGAAVAAEEKKSLPQKLKAALRGKNGGKKRRVLIGAAIAAAALLLLPKSGGQEGSVLDLSDTTVLRYTDLRSSISASGTIESANSTLVYSTASYTVKAVHVEVGDWVEEGQLLAELDDQNIQEQIRSQEISLNQSAASSAQQIQTAQDNYNNYKTGLEQGLNSTLNSAQNQVSTAYESYIKAKNTYERYKDGLDEGENTTLINAESALRTAENTMDAAEEAYDSAYDRRQSAASARSSAKSALTQAQANYSAAATEDERAAAQTALTAAQSAYEQADSSYQQAESALRSASDTLDNAEYNYDAQYAAYRAALKSADNNLADYESSMDSAWESYQNALTALEATEKSVQEQLQSYENTLASAKINGSTASARENLRQLRVDLEGTQITAPCAGTVTAVYAEVGGSGAGLLFVIEDVDDLIVDTSVKSYDVGTVQEGMKVVVRSDATGDEEFEGVISRIAPTSTKDSQGQTAAGSDAVFVTEVAITGECTGLRIGMEAELDYVIGEESHVLAAPYDAVYTNENGQTCVLVAEEQSDGRYLIRAIEVRTGADDDLDIVITGDGVTEGIRVINEAESYLSLLGQTVAVGTNRRLTGFPIADSILGG